MAALAASALGLADDLGSVSPRRRVAVQAVIGLALGVAVGSDLGGGVVVMGALGVVGVVALANFTNLVDNADGLAASLTTVSALTVAGIAVAAGLATGSRGRPARDRRRHARLPRLEPSLGAGVHGRLRQPDARARRWPGPR